VLLILLSRSSTSMATKAKNKKASNNKMGSQKKHVVKKEHGTLLMIALVIIAIHGIIAAYLYSTLSTAPEIQRPWIISMMVIHFLANIVAAIGIYYWKKWSLYVYAASAVLALVAGLISVGIWSMFYLILPLVILGWVLRSKWGYFE
jgi:Na+/glutamate symporter